MHTLGMVLVLIGAILAALDLILGRYGRSNRSYSHGGDLLALAVIVSSVGVLAIHSFSLGS